MYGILMLPLIIVTASVEDEFNTKANFRCPLFPTAVGSVAFYYQ